MTREYKKTAFNKDDLAAFLDESPSKKFTTTQLCATFSVVKERIYTWTEELMNEKRIKREKHLRHWVYFSLSFVQPGAVEVVANVAQPRKLFSNPMNKQNFAGVLGRLRTGANRITLANPREVSPYWAL